MRVCHVIESAAAGSAGIMLTLAERGAAAGEDVTVIYSPLRASAAFLDRARAGFARFVPLAMHRSIGVHDAAAALRLRTLLCAGRFDVIHSHSSKAGAVARLAGIGAPGVHVYSPHGFVTMAPDASALYRPIERFLSRFCAAIVAVSKKERQHALDLGIAASLVEIVPNGIAEGLIMPRAGFTGAARGDRFTIGFVGRFCEQKDPLLAIDAFARLHARFPQSRLVMIGGGELESEVAARIVALGLGANIALLGSAEAFSHYREFDALLCSSRFEGMPLTFLEALANGVPIISTDVGGVDELVDAGRTGFVAERTARALGDRLIAVAMMDPGARHAMTEQSLAKAREFSAQAMFDRTRALYEICLSRT